MGRVGIAAPPLSVASAPVSLGATVRGITPIVTQGGKDMVRVVGRDFVGALTATGTAANWTLVTGFPLNPNSFQSSILQSYCRIYSKFRFTRIRVLYVTSSATSANGDILVTYVENRSDPHPRCASTSFLNNMLSDESTILSVQWQNQSQDIKLVNNGTKTLALSAQPDLDETSQGEILVYSRTSGTDSPGYFLIDYDVSFYEMGLNPRSGSMPAPRMLYTPFTAYLPASLTVVDAPVTLRADAIGWVGGTTITSLATNGAVVGEVFKLSFIVTDGAYGNWTVTTGTKPTSANLLTELQGGSGTTLTITDGFTCYMQYAAVDKCTLYATYTGAMTNANPFVHQTAYTPATPVPGSTGVWVYGMCSSVGFSRANSLQSV